MNLYNFILGLGYSNGMVIMWFLNMLIFFVLIFCYCGFVIIVVYDFVGVYMVMGGMDG